ncbi:Gfo/Idh/MocA family protein [Granulicella sibirica]|uniref:Oxidoreductase n=1 Tax=Granulicella sibirica TaxID=2479048 RepID=A0A4Q0SXF1_9BACT|nr:Gfo/Idh/MocA family oxidoreductase [Granulicella sibirica]RXH54660.1 oxidoreductase [Granulicella sibirica]
MKIGVIGSGFMGGVHVAAIERIQGLTLTSVASRTRPSADAPARGNLKHLKSTPLPDHVQWYGDWREMLSDAELDAVDICLPTPMHRQVALRAFELGKHVLCEKPMALTTEDCDVMMEAATKSGRTFMIGQVLRFMFPYRYASTFVEQVGRSNITICTLSRRTGYPQWSEWLSREELCGGAIVDLLSHDIDQALVLFGMPESVSAVSEGEIDTMRGTLRYADGLAVTIEGGWLAPDVPFSHGFELASGETSLSFKDDKLQRTTAGKEEQIEVAEEDAYLDEIAYFADCCAKQVPPERCMPSESAEALRIANLLRASREQNGKGLSCAR